MKYILILLLSSVLFAALPPRVQERLDKEMIQSNMQLQEESSVVLKASVIKINEISPKNIPRRSAYYKKINLLIKVEKILRNKKNISIDENIHLRYSVFMPNYMPGPKIHNIIVPTLNESYVFYLNDNLRFYAKNQSIDTEFYTTSEKRIENNPSRSFTVSFDLALTSEAKEELKYFFKLNEYKRRERIEVSSYSYKSTDDYSLMLSMTKANKVKSFLIKKLRYKEENIFILAHGKREAICIDLNKNDFKKPCDEINERVMISITSSKKD